MLVKGGLRTQNVFSQLTDIVAKENYVLQLADKSIVNKKRTPARFCPSHRNKSTQPHREEIRKMFHKMFSHFQGTIGNLLF